MNRHRARAILDTIPSAFVGTPPQEFDAYKFLEKLGMKEELDTLLASPCVAALPALGSRYRFYPTKARHTNLIANYMLPRGTVGYIGSQEGGRKFQSSLPGSPPVLGFSDEPVLEPKLRLLGWDNFCIEYYQCIEALYLEEPSFHEIEAKLHGVPVWSDCPLVDAGTIRGDFWAAQRELNDSQLLQYLIGYDFAFPISKIIPPRDYPLISVCLNCHNRQSMVYLSLMTLITQSYPNYEIIAVDDASTDNSVKIIKQLAANTEIPIKIIELKNNVGCAEAWNTGIREAEGDYIYYASSDNIHEPKMLMNLAWGIFNTESDIVYSKARHFGAYSGEVHTVEVSPPKAAKGAGLGSAFLISSDFVRETDLMHSDELYVEDTSWTYDLLMCGAQVSFLNDTLIYYRVGHDTSLTKEAMQVGYGKLMKWMAERKQRELEEGMANLLEAVCYHSDDGEKSQLMNSLNFLSSYQVKITAMDSIAQSELLSMGIVADITDNFIIQNNSQKTLAKIYVDSAGRYSRLPYEKTPRGYGDRIYLYNPEWTVAESGVVDNHPCH